MVSINSLLGLVWNKAPNFVVLYDSKASVGPIHHIFLVHGFLDATFAEYRNVLERWIVKEVRKAGDSSRMVIWAFRFNMAKALSYDPEASLIAESQALRSHLLCLYEQEEPRPDDANDPFTDASDGSSGETRPQSIVFIAHGLGSWIVKEVLAMRNSRNFAFYPMGLIQIDAKSDKHYSDYISRVYKKFSIKPPSEIANEDEDQISPDQFLQTADNNFDKYKEFYYRQEKHYSTHSRRGQTVYEKQLREIWMADPPPILARTTSWGEWFRGHSRSAPLQLDALDDMKLENKIRKAVSQHEDLSNSRYWNPLVQSYEVSTDQDEINTQHSPLLKENQPANDADDHVFDENMTVMSDPYNHMTVLSEPDNFMTQDQSVEMNRRSQMAHSRFQRSDFDEADKLFKQYYIDMPKSKPPSTAEIKISMTIMSLRIYRGKYEEARTLLKVIKHMIKEARSTSGREEELNNLQRQRHRWLATYFLRTGRWEVAVKQLQKLSSDSQSVSNDDNVQRDLALAYAYLGRHDEAEQAIELAKQQLRESIENARAAAGNNSSPATLDNVLPSTSDESLLQRRDSQESKEDKTFIVKEQGINAVFAEVYLVAGDFAMALDLSSKALDTMNRILGTKHAKTLMTANIKSRCLAYAAKYSEAEPLCLRTLNIAKKRLGSKHPIYLEALELLVYIFRHQVRYTEAIDTGTALLESWPDELREDHPLAIRCKYQLGTAHLESGDYITAEKILTEVTNRAEICFGKSHPDHLRYRSRLAYALFCTGKRHQARKEIIETAILQMNLYKIAPPGSIITGRSSNKRSGDKLDFDWILDRLKQFNPAATKARLHPFLILTMRLLVRMEAGGRKANPAGRKKNFINELLRIITKPKPWTAAQSVLITGVQYDLVLILKEVDPSEENLSECIDMLDNVIQERSKALGEGHLDTLCAKRDWVITTCTRGLSRSTRGESSGIFLENAETLSLQILDSIQASVGEYHPEAVKSQLWYITVRLLSSTTDVELETVMEEVDNVIKRMKSPSIRNERLFDCLELEMKMASRLMEFELSEKAAQILRGTRSETEDAIRDESNAQIRPALEEVLSSIKAVETS